MIVNIGKKTLIVLIISAVAVVGAGIYFAFKPPAAVPETQATDIVSQNMLVQMEQYTQRLESLKTSVEREVRKLHETVSQEVAVMRPDDVAIGLNDELSRFRELSIRSSGVDDAGFRILD